MSQQSILEEAEVLKKRGDIHFAKNQYEDAISVYNMSLNKLKLLVGLSSSESLVIRCFANQSQCYIKLNQHEHALNSINLALTVPSISIEINLFYKLTHRKAIILHNLNKIEESLYYIDYAISLDQLNDDLLVFRQKLIDEITEKHGMIAIPPLPTPLTNIEINDAITKILTDKGDPGLLLEYLSNIILKRGWIDKLDERKNNVMWAICQAAIVRANTPEKDSDKVLPLLDAIIKAGSKAEQRFSHLGNKTPLQMFCLAGAFECVKLCIQNGASVYTLDDDHWSPLIVACAPNGPYSDNNSNIVKVLLDSRSFVNHKTKTGLTALGAAAQSKDVTTIKLLLQYNSKINIRCNLGFSPIVWAKISSHGESSDVVKYLYEYVEQSNDKDLLFEIEQDIKCYDFSNLIIKLKLIYNNRISTSISINDIKIELFDLIMNYLQITIDKPTITYPIDIIVSKVNQLVPVILGKLWKPKESSSIAISKANTLEKCWLNILTFAVTGPNKQDSIEVLESNDSIDFYYLAIYKDYRLYIQDVISFVIGNVLLTNQSIETISKHILTSSNNVIELSTINPSITSRLFNDSSINTISFDILNYDIYADSKSSSLLVIPANFIESINNNSIEYNTVASSLLEWFKGDYIVYIGPIMIENKSNEITNDSTKYLSIPTITLIDDQITNLSKCLYNQINTEFNTVEEIHLPNWIWFNNQLTIFRRNLK